jgi:hypothetical protein
MRHPHLPELSHPLSHHSRHPTSRAFFLMPLKVPHGMQLLALGAAAGALAAQKILDDCFTCVLIMAPPWSVLPLPLPRHAGAHACERSADRSTISSTQTRADHCAPRACLALHDRRRGGGAVVRFVWGGFSRLHDAHSSSNFSSCGFRCLYDADSSSLLQGGPGHRLGTKNFVEWLRGAA